MFQSAVGPAKPSEFVVVCVVMDGVKGRIKSIWFFKDDAKKETERLNQEDAPLGGSSYRYSYEIWPVCYARPTSLEALPEPQASQE